MQTKQRLDYFDVIKGIAIFLVVMGHVLTMCIRDIDKAFAFKIIGEVHMPLFFFISGFFTYKVNGENTFVIPNLTQRFKQLIIPFIVVGTLWIWYFPHSGLNSPLNPGISGFYSDLWKNGYWFTLCLFEIILFYSATSYLLRRTNSLISQIFTIIITWGIIGLLSFSLLGPEISNMIGLPLTFQFYPIFMFGVLAKKNKDKFLSIISTSAIFTVNILAASVVLYAICYYWEIEWINIDMLYPFRVILHITLACAVTCVVKKWSESMKENKIRNVFQLLGKESLSIYLLHYFFLFPIGFLQTPLQEMGLGFTPTVFVAAIIASIIITIVLIINFIISNSNILALLLTGKVKK